MPEHVPLIASRIWKSATSGITSETNWETLRSSVKMRLIWFLDMIATAEFSRPTAIVAIRVACVASLACWTCWAPTRLPLRKSQSSCENSSERCPHSYTCCDTHRVRQLISGHREDDWSRESAPIHPGKHALTQYLVGREGFRPYE